MKKGVRVEKWTRKLELKSVEKKYGGKGGGKTVKWKRGEVNKIMWRDGLGNMWRRGDWLSGR